MQEKRGQSREKDPIDNMELVINGSAIRVANYAPFYRRRIDLTLRYFKEKFCQTIFVVAQRDSVESPLLSKCHEEGESQKRVHSSKLFWRDAPVEV